MSNVDVDLDKWHSQLMHNLTMQAERQNKLIQPFYEFISKHGLSKYSIGNESVSHDTFIAIAYTSFVYNFKPEYDFCVYNIFGKDYLRSMLIYNIEGCDSVMVFRNERICNDDIIDAMAIPFSLKYSDRVILPDGFIDKIDNTIKSFNKVHEPIVIDEQVQNNVSYLQNTTNSVTCNKQKVCYIMIDSSTKYVKIGNSINPEKRERTLQSEKPTIELLHIFKKNIETELHSKYKAKRVRGEWFDLSINEVKKIIKKYDN